MAENKDHWRVELCFGDICAMLTMKLFGPLDIKVSGAGRGALGAQAAVELIALLTLHHGRGLRSSWVADLIWPDTGSLDSLRQAVRAARDVLGEEGSRLELSNQTVILHLEGADVDMIAFDEAIVRGNQGDEDALRTAVSLYNGPLLEGWENPWVLRERETRNEHFVSALALLAAAARDAGDHEAAARTLRRLVSCRPRLESAWCDLMRSLVEQGERMEAMEVHRRYCEFLKRVGKGKLRPPAEMERQYEQLLALPLAAVSAPEAPSRASTEAGEYEPIGGAVPLDSIYYVERPADELQRTAIAHRDSILLIKGPRQIGKTSLLARGLDQARRGGAQVFLTDMQKLSAAHMETIDTFFLSIAHLLAAQVDGIAEPRQVWNADWDGASNFERFLRREVLGRFRAPVVWGLDEVDRLFHCDFKDDVFGLFRAWHNERSLDPEGPWGRLTLAMAYATEAHLFITNLNQSPFNVGTRIVLEDFTEEQVADLCQRYGLSTEDESARVFALLGGHPYLVRRCLHAMQTQGIDMNTVEAEAESNSGVFGSHLERVLQTLLQDPDLAQAVRANGIEGAEYTSASFYRLRSAGVVAGSSPRTARPRCRLYDEFLKRQLG
jgi:DNA-binding SARP family transcriptional activator